MAEDSAVKDALRLGTVLWKGRRTLVAPLSSDEGRLVALHRVEQIRLAKLGEGQPEALAKVLVPSTLLEVLDAGSRALNRIRQVLAYAEKWERRGGLPEDLAFPLADVERLPCLPTVRAARRADGSSVGREPLRGPGAVLSHLPQVSLAAVGLFGGRSAGFCVALEDPEGMVLGGWMAFQWPHGQIRIDAGGHRRTVPFETWEGLQLPGLSPGELRLLPTPRMKPFPGLAEGDRIEIRAPFDQLELVVGAEIAHPTLQ